MNSGAKIPIEYFKYSAFETAMIAFKNIQETDSLNPVIP